MTKRKTERHESLERLLAAAGEANVKGPSALAKALNESDQTITNWGGKRGVSKAGAMKAQAVFGCSAVWVMNGELPKYVHEKNQPPVVKGAVFEALSSEEKELVAHFRHLLGKDRRAKLAEIAQLAQERLAEREELLAEAGVTAIAERAAHATRKRTAAATVEPGDRLRQRSLLDDES